jgi:hypothetical protein
MKKLVVLLAVSAALIFGQARDASRVTDGVTAQIGHPSVTSDISGPLPHPAYIEQRRPKLGCVDTAECGDIVQSGWTHNLRTSAGATYQYNQMFGTPSTVFTYIGLTDATFTPAFADTSLTSEIAANGLSRHVGVATNLSTTLAVPAAPTTAVTGSSGTTYYYWVAACNLVSATSSICTTPSATSGSASAAATLNATNYVTVSFTGQIGASGYQVSRTTANTAPTGTVSNLVPVQASCTVGDTHTAPACIVVDVGAALVSNVYPASNLTSLAEASLVYTWTCTTTAQAVKAFGIFNQSSSGTLGFEGLTLNALGAAVEFTLQVGDTIQLSWYPFF